MELPLAKRFDRIINENLPKRKEMIEVLKGNALEAELFSKKGQGLKSILAHIGRVSDFKGIYGFIERDNIVYIDESSYVIKRIIRQFKGNSNYQLRLANIMIDCNRNGNSQYDFDNALSEMNKMKVIFMDLPDDLERRMTALYLKCQYECPYNRFE